MIYMNVRKLMAHLDEVKELIERRKPLILVLTETCVTININDEEISIEGYVCYNLNSHSRMTGGCVAYVNKNLKTDLLLASAIDKCTWILSFKVSNFSDYCTFTVVYNSPAASKRKCLQHLEEWFENNFDCATNNIICGDFNVDLMKSNSYTKQLNQLMQFYGVKQLVSKPTRITEFSKSKLDLVMTNCDCEPIVLKEDKISDHSTILIKKNLFSKEVDKNVYVDRVIAYSKDKFIENLNRFEWNNLGAKSLNEKTEIFTQRLKESISEFIKSVRQTKSNENQCNGTMKSCGIKD